MISMTYVYVALFLTHSFVIIVFYEENKIMNKIPFTIKFPQTEYTKHEVSNFS